MEARHPAAHAGVSLSGDGDFYGCRVGFWASGPLEPKASQVVDRGGPRWVCAARVQIGLMPSGLVDSWCGGGCCPWAGRPALRCPAAGEGPRGRQRRSAVKLTPVIILPD